MLSSHTTHTTMSDAPDFSGAANADCVDSQVHDGVANEQRPYNLRLREKRPVVSQKMQMSGKKQKVKFIIVLTLSSCRDGLRGV
jgi:hypothetical protein